MIGGISRLAVQLQLSMNYHAVSKPQTSTLRILLVLIVTIAVSMMGVNMMLAARADTPDPAFWDEVARTGYISPSQYPVPHTSYGNNVISVQLLMNIPDTTDGPLHVHLESREASPELIQYMRYECDWLSPCLKGKPFSGYTYTFEEQNNPVFNFVTCINVNPKDFGRQAVPIITIYYKKLAAGKYNLNWRERWYRGTCSQPEAYLGWMNSGGQTGQIGLDHKGTGQTPGDNNADSSPGSSNDTSSGNSGTGAGQTGEDGAAQNSGANTADQRSELPRPLPASSNQGNKEQPELEPSPFFDGRQYEPGSKPDSIVTSTVSNAGRAVTKNWPLALGTVAIIGAAGYVAWRRWH